MKITSRELKEHIRENKYFATMRNYAYQPGILISLNDEGGEIGKAVVLATFLNTLSFRKALVKYSGFNNVGEWEREAENINKESKRKLPRYIVLCKITELYALNEEEIDMSINNSQDAKDNHE